MNRSIDLSIVIPVYNEIESLEPICDEFQKNMPDGTNFEIIMVNDGNFRNDVYNAVNRLRKRPYVRTIHLAKNYGQHVAIAAGLKNALGEFVLVTDSDLQYAPSDSLKLYVEAKKNKHDLVVSLIQERAHSFFKEFGAKFFYWLMTTLGTKLRPDLGSVFVVHRRIADGLLRMADRNRLTITMAMWLSQNIGYLNVVHSDRKSGKSGYTLSKLLWHGINGVIYFSTKLLYFSFVFSSLFSLAAIAGIIFIIFKAVIMKQAFPAGWASLVVIVLACTATVLASLTVVGHYLGRVFELVKHRPLYFLQDSENNTLRLFEEDFAVNDSLTSKGAN
jgi:dolichol-phosphate mannosyltransferase